MRTDALPARDKDTGLVHVVIDTPRGSANKYKCDEATGLYKISRILPAGMHFPCDFGSVPQTRAEDGDPFDALVLIDAPTFAGCLLTTKLIGALQAPLEAFFVSYNRAQGREFRVTRRLGAAAAARVLSAAMAAHRKREHER